MPAKTRIKVKMLLLITNANSKHINIILSKHYFILSHYIIPSMNDKALDKFSSMQNYQNNLGLLTVYHTIFNAKENNKDLMKIKFTSKM